MKPHLPAVLLASLLSAVGVAAAATDPGSIVFVGDSITHGGSWEGAGLQPSYRYSFFKNMVDQGLTYNPMGIGTGPVKAHIPALGTLSYRGTEFNNTHEAAASARTYTWSGIPEKNAGYNNNPNVRDNEAPVWNFLGLTNPQTNSTTTYYNRGTQRTYTGPTYASKYGEAKPQTVCLMIGINDLLAVKSGTHITREDGSTSAYTYQDVIANTKSIVDAYQQYNPGVEVVVMGLLPTAPNNGTYNMSDGYNELLQEAVKSWSTGSSTVTYAEVSQGLSITNQNHYDNGGAHPNNQGELIIAGNLANALGVGQRTLGLTGKSAANLANRVDTTTTPSTGVTFTGTTGATAPGVNWSTFNDASAHVGGLLIQAGGASTASLSVGAEGGWDADFSNGFTLQTSVQLYGIGGNSLFLRFGDGTVGDGLLRVTESGVYWGTGNTLLFEGMQTSMNDFRIVYMPTGNTQEVAAGYYVWRNNQLIGEALAAGTAKTDALTIGSADGSLTYAGIADIAWENASWAPENSANISASMNTASLPAVTELTGDAIGYSNISSDLNSTAAWSTGTLPSGSDTIRFDRTYAQESVSLSAELAVLGAQFETASAVKITSNAAANTLSVGSGGITVSNVGSNVFIQRLKLTDAQTWNVGAGKFLRIGTANAGNNGSLTAAWSSDDHTVTIQDGGTVILATASGALQAIDWKVTGGSMLKAIWNTAGSSNLGGLGNGSVTLDNGTLGVNYGTEGGGAASHGNWNWANALVIGQGGGTIAQFATSGANRNLNLSGSISLAEGATAEATLTFSKPNSLACDDQHGFILSGNQSSFSGKIVIETSTNLRVGALSATSENAGNNGTLHAGILEIRTGGSVTLTRTDTWTVASTITGSGTINVGSALDGMTTASQCVTLSGNNSAFTGTININQGTLVLGHARALGAASAVAVKAGGMLDLNGHTLSGMTPTFTAGGKVTNSADTAAKIAIAGTGVTSTVWNNSTIEAAEGKTIQLEVTTDHAAFNGKLSGSGTIEKLQNSASKHLIIKSGGNEFNGKLFVSQGYLILDSANNAQTFSAGYRPDLEIASGASFTVGNAYVSEESALKLGNVTGSGNFTADYGNNTRFIDVQTDQAGGAAYDGTFQSSSTNNRDYSVVKRGAETWTLTGAHTATGFLKSAEGDLLMQGTWVGSTEVVTGATMTVRGAVGATGSDRTHTVQQGGVMKLTGTGEVRNNGAVVSVKSEQTEAVLGNVTVASTGISRTSAEGGTGVVSNADIRINQPNVFTIENVRLADSLVDLVSSGSVTLNNVVISAGTALQANSGGSFTVRNSALELSSANLTTSAGTSPVGLTYALNATVEGSFTLTFTRELMAAIGTWESGPYDSVRLTLIDVNGWGDGVDIQFAGGDTLFCNPGVTNVTVNGNTVTIDITFGKPIPEPASAALGLLGISGLFLRRRRRT